jgi:hypothetical protein
MNIKISRQGIKTEEHGEVAEKEENIKGEHQIEVVEEIAGESSCGLRLVSLLLGKSLTVALGIKHFVQKMALLFVFWF